MGQDETEEREAHWRQMAHSSEEPKRIREYTSSSGPELSQQAMLHSLQSIQSPVAEVVVFGCAL